MAEYCPAGRRTGAIPSDKNVRNVFTRSIHAARLLQLRCAKRLTPATSAVKPEIREANSLVCLRLTNSELRNGYA
jgi:hypothetical protein